MPLGLFNGHGAAMDAVLPLEGSSSNGASGDGEEVCDRSQDVDDGEPQGPVLLHVLDFVEGVSHDDDVVNEANGREDDEQDEPWKQLELHLQGGVASELSVDATYFRLRPLLG